MMMLNFSIINSVLDYVNNSNDLFLKYNLFCKQYELKQSDLELEMHKMQTDHKYLTELLEKTKK